MIFIIIYEQKGKSVDLNGNCIYAVKWLILLFGGFTGFLSSARAGGEISPFGHSAQSGKFHIFAN